MKQSKPNKAHEAEFINKIRSMIDHLYPGIEEEMREVFTHKNKDIIKIINRKVDFRLAFYAWFLLKHEFSSGATAMEMADSFPLDYFNEKDKKMIKNFLNYKESLFEILNISEDNKDYTLQNLFDNKPYLVKTIDFPVGFKEKELIQAMIIKNLEGNYFFYGTVQSFNIKNKDKFIKKILERFKIENTIRKEREKAKIDWEIQK